MLADAFLNTPSFAQEGFFSNLWNNMFGKTQPQENRNQPNPVNIEMQPPPDPQNIEMQDMPNYASYPEQE